MWRVSWIGHGGGIIGGGQISSGADFAPGSFGSDLSAIYVNPWDASVLMQGTDDADSHNSTNFRVVVSPNAFMTVPGTSISGRLEFRFGSACPTVTAGISSVWFGQRGASAPNFAGDQVQVKFSGGSSVNASAGAVVTSDSFNLAQALDTTKNYVCSFFVSTGGVSLAETSIAGGVTTYTDNGSHGSDESSATTPAGTYTSTASLLQFLEKISIIP